MHLCVNSPETHRQRLSDSFTKTRTEEIQSDIKPTFVRCYHRWTSSKLNLSIIPFAWEWWREKEKRQTVMRILSCTRSYMKAYGGKIEVRIVQYDWWENLFFIWWLNIPRHNDLFDMFYTINWKKHKSIVDFFPPILFPISHFHFFVIYDLYLIDWLSSFEAKGEISAMRGKKTCHNSIKQLIYFKHYVYLHGQSTLCIRSTRSIHVLMMRGDKQMTMVHH